MIGYFRLVQVGTCLVRIRQDNSEHFKLGHFMSRLVRLSKVKTC
jgi:hypothetical protein